MLEKIKSSYFTQVVFFHIYEKIKLKIVKYNKRLQKKLNINLINYKLFKGSYIIFEENGIGKEYTALENRLIFEGEYSKGEKSGKGKEYNNIGELIFEGEYLNGKRWNGKGYRYFYHRRSIDEFINKGKYLKIKYFKESEKEKDSNFNCSLGDEFSNRKKSVRKRNDMFNITVYELENGKGFVKEYYYFSDKLC